MRRIWLVLLIVLGAFAIIGYNAFAAATNESFFPLIFRLSMIPTYTPTETLSPTETLTPTETLIPSPTSTGTITAEPSPTPTATETATQVLVADVKIVRNAVPLQANVTGEYVELVNQGTGGINLEGWLISDEEDNEYFFPSFFLESGATVKIWTKSGTDTTTDLYWGRTQEVWNDSGDVVTLEDNNRTEIDAFEY